MKTNTILIATLLAACGTTSDRIPDAAESPMRQAEPTHAEPLLLRPEAAPLWNYAGGPISPVLDCRSGSPQAYCHECGGQGGPCCTTPACVIECDDYCRSRKTACCAPL